MSPPVIRKAPKLPGVLVVHEKHGHSYYHVRDEEHLYRTILVVAQGFQAKGYYIDPTADNRRINAVLAHGGIRLWVEMQWRALEGYEYEYLEVVQPEEVP